MTELSLRQRRTVLAICSMSLFIVGIDNTIVNVALPSIGHDFDASISGLQWTVDSYTVVIASLLMLSGSMADRFGRRRVFQLGLTLFSLGSLLCSVAPSLGWLLVFRMLQAVGGSMLNPVAMSIIRNTFTDARERAAAIGVWGAVIGISLALGPVVGGALTDSIGWRAIFWVNVPVGVAAIILTALFVPESRAPRPRRVDPVGQVLVIVLLATLTYGIIEGPSAGWASAQTIGVFAISLIALVALLRYEPRRRDPLIELGFFRSAPFTGASVIAIAAFAALGGFLFLNTLYLQDVRGLSALDAGFYTLPLAAVTVIVSPISGRIVGRRGSRPSLLVGGHRDRDRQLHVDRPDPPHCGVLVAGLLPRLRDRLRRRQRTDHQHRGVRHAARTGRRRGRDRLDLAPDRSVARGRRHRRHRDSRRPRLAGVLVGSGQSPRLVDRDRLRRRHRGGRAADHHGVGEPHRGAAPPTPWRPANLSRVPVAVCGVTGIGPRSAAARGRMTAVAPASSSELPDDDGDAVEAVRYRMRATSRS